MPNERSASLHDSEENREGNEAKLQRDSYWPCLVLFYFIYYMTNVTECVLSVKPLAAREYGASSYRLYIHTHKLIIERVAMHLLN